MSDNWRDYVSVAIGTIEADDFACAEMFVANKEAVLKYPDDPNALFEFATLFGASLILQICDNSADSSILEKESIHNG